MTKQQAQSTIIIENVRNCYYDNYDVKLYHDSYNYQWRIMVTVTTMTPRCCYQDNCKSTVLLPCYLTMTQQYCYHGSNDGTLTQVVIVVRGDRGLGSGSSSLELQACHVDGHVPVLLRLLIRVTSEPCVTSAVQIPGRPGRCHDDAILTLSYVVTFRLSWYYK